MTLFTEI